MVIQVLFLFLIRKKLEFPFFRKYVFWKGRKSPLEREKMSRLLLSSTTFSNQPNTLLHLLFMYSRHFLRRLHKMFNRCTSYSLYSSYLIFLWALLPETCYITLHCEKMLPWYYVYLCLKTFFYDKTKRFKRIIVSYIYSNATRSAVFDKSQSIHHFFFVVLYYREQILLQVLTSSVSTPEAFP